DRTPPTDDPTPIGTANGPKGIYGRRSLSKPPKPTILDLSYRPHHKRLPRQRFSATKRYGTWQDRRLFRLDARELHDLGPFLGFGRDEGAELRCGEDHRQRADLGEPRLDGGVCQRRADLAVEPFDDLRRRAPRPAHAPPG